MANERITERILEEARVKAAEIIASAEENAKTLLTNAREKSQADCEAILLKADEDAAEKQRRAVVVAELDSRKKELSVKRDALDIAYERAAQKFFALDDAAYSSTYVKITLAAISKGEEVICPAKTDEKRLGKGFIDRLNKAAADKGLASKITLGEPRADITGGLIVSYKGMEINISTASVLRSVREETEGQVARILFAAQEG